MDTQTIIKTRSYQGNLPISDIFKNRFSPLVFSNQLPNDKDLITIFEAVKLTPSSYNSQPWFFYISKKGTNSFLNFSELLMQGNDWAKKVPILILACYIEKDEKGINQYAQYDLGQAVATLTYQAQALNYYTHQMAGFDKDKAKKLVESNHQPWVMIALGKIGDYQKAPEKLIEKDLKQKPRKKTIYKIL